VAAAAAGFLSCLRNNNKKTCVIFEVMAGFTGIVGVNVL
jgi:hypothetical protein